MVPAQHEHGLDLAPITGTHWLQLLVLVGVHVVVAHALLHPFLPPPGRSERLVVTGAAVVVVVVLLLGNGIDAPRQAAVAALAAAAVPLGASHRSGRPLSVLAGRAAPGVALACAAVAGVELVRAALGTDATGALVRTGVLGGVIGLSWLVLCRPSPRATTAAHALRWGLGNAVLAGTAALAVAGLPT